MNVRLLDRIDMIQEASIDAELNVLGQMADSYMKAITILENYDGDDTSAFAIFQEADNFEKGLDKQANSILAQAKGKPNENLIKRIILFIPRLIKAIISKITSSDRIFKKRINNLEKEIKNKMNNKSSGSKGDTTELKGTITHQKGIPMKGYVEPDWYKGGAPHNPPDMEIKLIFGATKFTKLGKGIRVIDYDVWEELDLNFESMHAFTELEHILFALDYEVDKISDYPPSNKSEKMMSDADTYLILFNNRWSEYHDTLEKKTKNLSTIISKMRENKKTVRFESWDQMLDGLKDYTRNWGEVTNVKKWLKDVEKIYNKLAEYPERSLKSKDGEKVIGFDFTTYEPYQTALKTTLSICNLSTSIVSQLEAAYKEDLDTIEKFVKGGYQ